MSVTFIQSGRFGGSVPLTHSFVTQVESASDLAGYTFAATSLGVAASDRRIVIVAVGRSTNTTTSCTVDVGGVSATVDLFDGYTGTGNGVVVAHAHVPTGTTGDVVITWSAVQVRCAASVYRVTGGDMTVTDTAVASDFSTTPTDLVLSPTVDDGVMFAGFISATGAGTATWAGATEDTDNQIGAEASSFSSASGATTATGDTITITAVSTTSNKAAAVAYEGA